VSECLVISDRYWVCFLRKCFVVKLSRLVSVIVRLICVLGCVVFKGVVVDVVILIRFVGVWIISYWFWYWVVLLLLYECIVFCRCMCVCLVVCCFSVLVVVVRGLCCVVGWYCFFCVGVVYRGVLVWIDVVSWYFGLVCWSDVMVLWMVFWLLIWLVLVVEWVIDFFWSVGCGGLLWLCLV